MLCVKVLLHVVEGFAKGISYTSPLSPDNFELDTLEACATSQLIIADPVGYAYVQYAPGPSINKSAGWLRWNHQAKNKSKQVSNTEIPFQTMEMQSICLLVDGTEIGVH